MHVDLVQPLRPRLALRHSPLELIVCPLCLRVLRDSAWIEAERAIRELRTYGFGALPRLESAVCDHCAESIFSRRSRAAGAVAS